MSEPVRVIEVLFPGVPGPAGPPGTGITVTDDGSIVVEPTVPNFAVVDNGGVYYPADEVHLMPSGTQAIYNPFDISLSVIGA
jgi:hypothetical protein